LARKAIQEGVANRLGLSLEAAAEGIIRIVNANMLAGIRVVSVERGYDPREFTVVAFGGGGPVHAAELASELGAAGVLVPVAPGITSAMGLLMADFRHDYTRTFLQTTDRVDLDGLHSAFRTLENRATEQLSAEGVEQDDILLSRSVEMRYRGQGYNLEVHVPSGPVDEALIHAVNDEFHRQHQAAYGYSQRDEVTEFVNLRLAGIGRLPKPRSRDSEPAGTDPTDARIRQRAAYFSGRWHEVPIFSRDRLQCANLLEGPAIVEQLDSTTVIPPGWSATVDGLGNLILTMDQ
jgi:N-methylhydantoinase A